MKFYKRHKRLTEQERKEIIPLLGTISDGHIARQYDVSVSKIQKLRVQKKIPPYRTLTKPFQWTEEAIALLGTDTDTAIAQQLGATFGAVVHKRRQLGILAHRPSFSWTEQAIALLGTDTDAMIAQRLGIDRKVVTNKRINMGVEAFNKKSKVTNC